MKCPIRKSGGIVKKSHLAILGLFMISITSNACKSTTTSAMVVKFSDTQGMYGQIILQGSRDTTGFQLNLQELQPGHEYLVKLYGGTCAQPSGSFTVVCSVIADVNGEAKAQGSLLFRGQEHVSYKTLTDGTRNILIESGSFQVCSPVIEQD
jgi:hypothetical protein